jgi:hypothetical protein
MAQLTYWALEAYPNVSLAQQAKSALTKQMSAMLHNQWTLNRHVCENYNPHFNGTDCTGSLLPRARSRFSGEADWGGLWWPAGDKFYHWGALPGFMALLEAGFY